MVIVQQTKLANWANYIRIFVISEDVSKAEREQGSAFLPKFDANGLICGIAVDAETRGVLMVAWLNQQAIDETLKTGLAHFYSRSRKSLWQKGETSGNVLKVQEIQVDCDQDALVMLVEPAGPACHTGQGSCFYRKLNSDGTLTPI